MSELFRYPYTVRFHDTDPAGIAFFGHFFRIAHEAYEEWLDSIGLPLARYVEGGRAGLPIASASAQFRSPMRLGQRIEIVLSTVKVGRTSYRLAYDFFDDAGGVIAEIESVHVYIESEQRKPTALPAELRDALT